MTTRSMRTVAQVLADADETCNIREAASLNIGRPVGTPDEILSYLLFTADCYMQRVESGKYRKVDEAIFYEMSATLRGFACDLLLLGVRPASLAWRD